MHFSLWGCLWYLSMFVLLLLLGATRTKFVTYLPCSLWTLLGPIPATYHLCMVWPIDTFSITCEHYFSSCLILQNCATLPCYMCRLRWNFSSQLMQYLGSFESSSMYFIGPCGHVVILSVMFYLGFLQITQNPTTPPICHMSCMPICLLLQNSTWVMKYIGNYNILSGS